MTTVNLVTVLCCVAYSAAVSVIRPYVHFSSLNGADLTEHWLRWVTSLRGISDVSPRNVTAVVVCCQMRSSKDIFHYLMKPLRNRRPSGYPTVLCFSNLQHNCICKERNKQKRLSVEEASGQWTEHRISL